MRAINSVPGKAAYLAPPIEERSGVALCLSGGGYRAALFHLGALRRLDELGVLPKVTTISSVSGGSIVNAYLATRLDPWPTAASDPRFPRFAKDLRDLTRKNIRLIPSFRWIERAYRNEIADIPLPELPDGGPNFVFCATDMANGVNWTFGRDLHDQAEPGRWEAGSYRAGFAPAGEIPLSRAVAASSAFPPVIGPVSVPIAPDGYVPIQRPGQPPETGITENLRLTDGGVYDNLGLEPVWKTHQTVLVSDGGATVDPSPYSPWKPWKRIGRYLSLATAQGGATRKRWLIASYEANRDDTHHYKGAYFGIGSEVSGYRVRPPETYPDELVDEQISEVRTDLDAFSDAEAAIIQNQGYIIADAAIRTWARELADPAPPAAKPPFADLMPATAAAEVLRQRKSHKRRYPPIGRLH
jgi:NTE family protein